MTVGIGLRPVVRGFTSLVNGYHLYWPWPTSITSIGDRCNERVEHDDTLLTLDHPLGHIGRS